MVLDPISTVVDVGVTEIVVCSVLVIIVVDSVCFKVDVGCISTVVDVGVVVDAGVVVDKGVVVDAAVDVGVVDEGVVDVGVVVDVEVVVDVSGGT